MVQNITAKTQNGRTLRAVFLIIILFLSAYLGIYRSLVLSSLEVCGLICLVFLLVTS